MIRQKWATFYVNRAKGGNWVEGCFCNDPAEILRGILRIFLIRQNLRIHSKKNVVMVIFLRIIPLESLLNSQVLFG